MLAACRPAACRTSTTFTLGAWPVACASTGPWRGFHTKQNTVLQRSRPAQHLGSAAALVNTRAAAVMASAIFNKSYRFILVSDLDWTMVNHDQQEHESLKAFNELWQSKFAADSLLVFSTGRSHKLYEELREHAPLLTPDVLVCSVGTEIFFEQSGEADAKWGAELDQGWNRDAALAAAAEIKELTPQAPSEQRPHKLSYSLNVNNDAQKARQVIANLEGGLAAAGVRAKVIYSGGVDVDILPYNASKGKGLEFLLKEIEESVGYPKDGVMVCGDSGNDVELFAVPRVRGCMVANAHAELRQWCDEHASPNIFQAPDRCAAGIVSALKHFQLVPSS